MTALVTNSNGLAVPLDVDKGDMLHGQDLVLHTILHRQDPTLQMGGIKSIVVDDQRRLVCFINNVNTSTVIINVLTIFLNFCSMYVRNSY